MKADAITGGGNDAARSAKRDEGGQGEKGDPYLDVPEAGVNKKTHQ